MMQLKNGTRQVHLRSQKLRIGKRLKSLLYLGIIQKPAMQVTLIGAITSKTTVSLLQLSS